MILYTGASHALRTSVRFAVRASLIPKQAAREIVAQTNIFQSLQFNTILFHIFKSKNVMRGYRRIEYHNSDLQRLIIARVQNLQKPQKEVYTMSEELKNVEKEAVTVENNALNIDDNRIKINGIAVKDFGIPATISSETKEAIAQDLEKMYKALKSATNSKFEIGEAIDDIRTHKTLEKLVYTENGKVKNVSDKATYATCAKLFKSSATTIKEAHLLYTTFKKLCVDGQPPIKEINGYPIENYNDTQLLAIAYALNAENVAGIECFNDTDINPMLSVKGVKTVCDKVTGKDKAKKPAEEAKKPDKETPLDKMSTRDFIGKVGDLLAKRLKTDEGKAGYSEMVKAHKALQEAYLKIAEAEKPENGEEAENK